jgi:Spy/CpxP family protein refolding chaperone
MSSPRYVVSRVNWRQTGHGWDRLPGEVPLASFPTLAAASADRDRREAAARAAVNPFHCGPAVHYWTTLDEPRLRDWLLDHDIPPPADGDWAAWWDDQPLTDDQRAGVWAALDRLTFFTVAERTGAVGYAVVRVNWEYNDEYYYAQPEGGTVLTVYRDRRKAEAACREQNEEARREWAEMVHEDETDEDDRQFDPSPREEAADDPFSPDPPPSRGGWEYQRKAAEVAFLEVVEIDLEGVN